MALQRNVTSSSYNEIQIIASSAVASAVIYTVPVGRKFIGIISAVSTTTGNSLWGTLNGLTFAFSGVEYTLFAGAVVGVSASGYLVSVIGIEADA
jgi:hypothetical protein